MKEREQNRLNMYKAVQNFLAENQATTATVPAFAEIIRNFDARIAAIEDAAVTHATATLGKTDRKHDAEQNLIALLLRIKAAAYACARTTGNHEVRAATALSESELRHLRDSELLRVAGIITDHASSIPGIDRFGGTPELLAAVREAISAFSSALNTREASVKHRTVTRSDLSELFRDAEETLAEDLDSLVELFRDDDPVFYDSYHAARIARAVMSKTRNGNGLPEATAAPGVSASVTTPTNVQPPAITSAVGTPATV
ncbi:MAG: hypothetical protein HY962_04370 [Ignavibacteriae bacterium]|nr:hypothetical protein [Ignavibacteriota bacterium]